MQFVRNQHFISWIPFPIVIPLFELQRHRDTVCVKRGTVSIDRRVRVKIN